VWLASKKVHQGVGRRTAAWPVPTLLPATPHIVAGAVRAEYQVACIGRVFRAPHEGRWSPVDMKCQFRGLIAVLVLFTQNPLWTQRRRIRRKVNAHGRQSPMRGRATCRKNTAGQLRCVPLRLVEPTVEQWSLSGSGALR
jgi:hypothetical protein